TAARAQIAFDRLEIVHSQTLRLGQRGRQCSRLVIEVGSASCGDSGQESISHQAGTQIVESLDEKDVLAKDGDQAGDRCHKESGGAEESRDSNLEDSKGDREERCSDAYEKLNRA